MPINTAIKGRAINPYLVLNKPNLVALGTVTTENPKYRAKTLNIIGDNNNKNIQTFDKNFRENLEEMRKITTPTIDKIDKNFNPIF